MQNFNPRPLAGATPRSEGGLGLCPISIHAPLRGRRGLKTYATGEEAFQSTPPCGGDNLLEAQNGSDTLFQSTPPCGGDLRDCRYTSQRRKFQSTPPCGGDREDYTRIAAAIISIHAPLRGRLAEDDVVWDYYTFQSTPPCGGDR